MRFCIVVVANKAPVCTEPMRLQLVCFMESFNLTTSRWSPDNSSYVFDAQLCAVKPKSRSSFPIRLKLCTLIRQDLLGYPIAPNNPI